VDLLPADIQRLWFSTQARPWAVLAVVPAQSSAGASKLAQALAKVGSVATGRTVRFLDAQTVELAKAAAFVELAHATSSEYCATIVVVGVPTRAPAAIPIASSGDALLLCVELGEADRTVASQTLSCLGGSSRFLGAVALHPAAKP
jgi:hypothetical protein